MSAIPKSKRVLSAVVFAAVLLSARLAPGADSKTPAASKPTAQTAFQTGVLPLFKTNCVACHGAELRQKELDLSTWETALKGGESGAVIVPGESEESRLYELITNGTMPPGEAHLGERDIEIIRGWIDAGAPSPDGREAKEAIAAATYDDIIPVVLNHCTACHGLRRQEGGLDLRTHESMLRGGKSGPAIVPGRPSESLLIRRIKAGDMPPKKEMLTNGVKPVGKAELAKLVSWIEHGTPTERPKADIADGNPDPLVSSEDRQYWAFQPPREVSVPAVRNQSLVRGPIDAFVLEKLEAKGLGLSPDADRLTLIRRIYFDLIGLPPKPSDVRAFLADKDPRAYEKLVDRLLASDRYGERWGRHWLDVAGYADSEGGKLSADITRPHAWRYRDYVIRAFNNDKPYDQFLLEQIAGDELVDYENATVITEDINEKLIATGFLRMGPDSTSEREVFSVADRVDVIADEIDVLGSAVMGLTVKCARCHSHKYDPIPQRDYYRLMAVLKGAYDEYDWLTPVTQEKYGLKYPGRYLPYVRPGAKPMELLEEEQDRELHNHTVERTLKEAKKAFDERTVEFTKKVQEERLQALPEELHEGLRKMLATKVEERTDTQKALAEEYGSRLTISKRELKDLYPAYRHKAERYDVRVKLLEAEKIPPPRIRALWDRGVPSPTYILSRGDPTSFGRQVGPGVPSALTDGRTPFEATPPWPGSLKTGRRLAFARWLIQPDHPLTARVMVNRIWQHHFGGGLVRSTGNFGKTGDKPSHPELLDWLAVRFVKEGWSIKAMHRLMVTSSVYRQASKLAPEREQRDPDNRLLSRMPLKKMEAEVLNDSILAVSGRLNETPYGRPSPVLARDDGLVSPIETENGWRRSIYVQQRRKEIPTVLDSFDLPAMSPNCTERTDSTVSTQALFLMNNAQVHEWAVALARRVESEAGPGPAAQIETMYWIALSRPPTNEERNLNLSAWTKLTEGPSGSGAETTAFAALTKLCHTVLNSAAFLYID
jgi:mono/diheme cytochrome c family protein